MDRKDLVAAPFSHNHRTICEVHRDIYDILADHYEGIKHFSELVDLLQESYLMAKKMDAKLLQYKRDYSIDWYEKQRDGIMQEKIAAREARPLHLKNIRPDVWNILDPLVGESMLELGNKANGDGKGGRFVYKDFFERMGFRHVSVDLNGQDGALKLDLRKPLNLGTFDMVTNFGTSEHVSDDDYAGQVACWRNMLEAMHVGSVLVSITPRKGSEKWKSHGRWYPEPEFFMELARLNALELERIEQSKNRVFARLLRRGDVEFRMPDKGMYENPNKLTIPQIT